MRRLHSVAAVFLLLALAPASAQMRGGGRGPVGGHGGFAGRSNFGGHLGGHAFGGMPSGRGFSGQRFQSHGVSRGSSFRQPNFFRDRSRGDRFRGDRFRGDRFRGNRFHHRRFNDFDFDDLGNCFGCGWGGGWPSWYAGYYDPYWYWDSHSSYHEDREREIQLAQEMNAESLEEQRMRRQEDQDLYARSEPAPQVREAQNPEAPGLATVLVFRDQ